MQVIIYYRADWCGPCKFVAPVFQRLSNEYAGVAFYSVDVDSTPVSMSALLLHIGSDVCLLQNG